MAFQDVAQSSAAVFISINAFINGELIPIVDLDGEFSYKYSMDDPDKCTFTVRTSDLSLIDSPQLQEQVELRVIWGYAGGPFSPTRKVFIENLRYSYEDFGVIIKVEALDKGANLSKGSKNTVYANKTINEIAEDVASRNNLKYSMVPFEDADTGDVSVYGFYKTDGAREGFNLDTGKGYSVAVPAIESTAVQQFAVFEKVISNYPQANNTDKFMLDDLLNQAEGGPYYAETRDDTLTIKKKNLSGKPVKSYTYKGERGELLSFEPESKSLSKGSKSTKIKSGAWDEENKEFYSSEATEYSDDNTRLGEEIDLPPDGVTSENLGFVGDDGLIHFDDLDGSSDVPGIIDHNIPVIKNINTASEGFKMEVKPGVYNYIPATENTAINIQAFDFFSPEEYGSYLQGNTGTKDSIPNEANNARTNSALDKNPGSCDILGEPALENNQIITIMGVSKKHTGNYLITDCEHTIGNTYITTCKLKRNAVGRVSEGNPQKASTSDIKKETNNQVGASDIDDSIELKVVEAEGIFVLPDDI